MLATAAHFSPRVITATSDFRRNTAVTSYYDTSSNTELVAIDIALVQQGEAGKVAWLDVMASR
jgi:predicted 3-demethylubiquinone-9 3-methyltransferase (glyoxalase superfamily)